jgi:hypothetical protein
MFLHPACGCFDRSCGAGSIGYARSGAGTELSGFGTPKAGSGPKLMVVLAAAAPRYFPRSRLPNDNIVLNGRRVSSRALRVFDGRRDAGVHRSRQGRRSITFRLLLFIARRPFAGRQACFATDRLIARPSRCGGFPPSSWTKALRDLSPEWGTGDWRSAPSQQATRSRAKYRFGTRAHNQLGKIRLTCDFTVSDDI